MRQTSAPIGLSRLVLRIPYGTPSLNELVNQQSRWAYAATRAKWRKRITDAYLDERAKAGRRLALWPLPPPERIRVIVHRYGVPSHFLDHDNFIGGLKPIIDGLKALSLITDDDHAAIDLIGEQRRNPYTHPRIWTEITLERLEDGDEHSSDEGLPSGASLG